MSPRVQRPRSTRTSFHKSHKQTKRTITVFFREGGGDILITRKNLIAIVLTTLFLSSFISMIGSTRSVSNVPYDPWADLNDDGDVDIYDAILFANAFGGEGTPLNKTELLYNVNDTYASLLSQIDSLNSSLLATQNVLNTRVTTLEAMVAQQQVRIAELEAELALVNVTKLGRPVIDSGWMNITAGETLVYPHRLNTTDVLVYVIGKTADGLIHQIDYGFTTVGIGASHYGVAWSELDGDIIKITRGPSDSNWVQVRLMMWVIP